MSDLKLITKITLFWYGIAGLMFAFMYIGITDIYLNMVLWPYYDPFIMWIAGANLLALGIVSLFALFSKKDWQEIKILVLLFIVWVIVMLITTIAGIVVLNLQAGVPIQIMNAILLVVNLIVGLASWVMQEK
jgi:FtsH-binding integral membrane protein